MKKWFYKQNRIIQILLLLIPIVGFVVELLCRIEGLSKKVTLGQILMFILVFFYAGEIIDIIFVILTGKLFLAD